MRISQRNILLTHNRTMQTTLQNLTNSNNKMSSGREIRRAYEAPSDAARAMRVRKQLRDDALFKANIDEVHGRLNSADSYLQELANMSKVILDKVEQACNGTYSLSDREKIAVEVEALQKEVLAVSNATYAQKYLFEAAGGAYAGEPFETNLEQFPLLHYNVEMPVVDDQGNVQWETRPNLNANPPVLGVPQTQAMTVQMGTYNQTVVPEGKYIVTAQNENTGMVTLAPLQMETKKYVIDDEYIQGDWNDVQVPDTITLTALDTTNDPPTLITNDTLTFPRDDLNLLVNSKNIFEVTVGTGEKEEIFYEMEVQLPAAGQTFEVPMTALADMGWSHDEFVVNEAGDAFTQRTVYTSDGEPFTIPVHSPGITDPTDKGVITPITVTEEVLTYHGMVVDQLTYNKVTGTVQQYVMDEATGLLRTNDDGTLKKADIPYNRTNYIDIGLGFEVMTIGSDKYLDIETALPFTMSGARVFGVGVDEETGLSHNMYNYLGNVVEALRNDDIQALSDQLDHFYSVHDTLLTAVADIGARFNFADDMRTIITNDEYVMTDKQVALEAVDLQKEAIYNKSFDMAWMVTLQLGSRIIPTSLFDFMR